MATKNYDNFDFDAYQRNQNKNSNSNSKTSYDSYDFDDYFIRQNISQIGENLNSSINSWLKKNESFYKSYNDRVSRYDGKDALDWTYESDSADWLSSVTTQTTNLKQGAKEILSWLDQYKDYLDADYYVSVKKAINDNVGQYGGVISTATDIHSHWSNWETEDAYNKYVAQEKDYNEKLNFNLEAGKVEISGLESQYGKASNIANELSSLTQTLKSGYTRAGYSEDKIEELIANDSRIVALKNQLAQYGDPSALASTLSEKKAYYTLAERAQKAVEFASVADVESENYDPEFEKYANQGQSMDDGNTPWMFFGNTVADNPIEAWRRYYADYPSVEEDYGAGKIGNEASFALAMTEDEVNVYNYYLAKEGKDKAEEYLDLIAESVNSRVASGLFSQVQDKPVLEYAFAVASGLDQFASGIEGWFADGYTPTSSIQMASGMVREDLADTGAKLPDWLGGGSTGQVFYDVVNTTSNMLPSILASTAANVIAPGTGAAVGAVLMGGSAGGNARQEMLNLGYSKEQATTYGLMVGAAEASMEYLLGHIPGLSSGDGVFSTLGAKAATKVDNAIARVAIKLGNKGTSILKAVANGAIKITAGALDEALEEGLQTVIEPWLKEIATSVDWEDPSIDEVLYSSLLGALSSVALGGIGDIVGEVKTVKSGKNIQNINGGVGKLQDLATNYFSADTVAYKIASKVNAQTDAYTIGRLLNEVGGTISEQNLTDIVNGLEAKGIKKSDATKLARQFQAILNADMNISEEAKAILNNIPGLNSVLRENLINKNTTVYQRTKAYSDLMNLAEETANQKKGKTTESKVDSLESLANSMVARGVDGRVAGFMASKAKSELDSKKPSTEARTFEQSEIDAMEKIASEVASGARVSVSERAVKKTVDSASDAAADRLGVEGKYASTDTGATRLASNKKKVNVVGVDSIEDGVMKLKLDDGSIVSADEIDFSTSDEALVYEAVTNMGVSANTAWEILKAYNPKSNQKGTIYAMGALEAYTYGHNGVKVEGMSQDGFSALLSPTQKNTANRLGDIDARAKVEAQQKTIDKAVKSVRDEAKSKHKAIPKRNGEVVFDGDRARLTDLQEKQLDVLGKISEGLGVTFHIFESDENFKYTMPDGKVRSANGWYDPKTGEIWIDLKAGNIGQGTIIFTAAHELTHFIKQWSPAKFKIFADFLVEQYGKKGQDINQLIERQIEKASATGRTISWDTAYEEVIADSCETFLRDSKAAERIAALREKDINLANKIKTFLGQMLAKMRKVMADLGLAPETPEGQMVAEMTDSIEKLYNLWTDALADAGTAYSTVGGEINLDGDSNSHILSDRTMVEGAGLQFIPDADGVHYQVLDADGNPVESVTPKMIANSPLGQLVSSAQDNGFLGKGKAAELAATKQYKFLAELVNMCIKYDGLAPVWEVAGTMVFSSIKSNADKQYGLTIDFSTVCKKTQAIVDAMSEAMVRLGRGLTRSEVETIYLEVGKAGESTPCPVCYVFSRWMGIGGILDQMSRFQDKYTNMSERDLQAFIADIKRRITERANTPNKNGELKKDFFDKNGAIKEGQVIADLKQKANSGAGSALKAISKNSDTQLEIQELKALMENQDAKEAKKTATKIKKLEAKLVDVSALEKQFKDFNDTVEEYEAYQWLTRTLMEEVDGKWIKNKKFKPVPKDVLFDLNKGATFAEDYPLSWAFRTGKGASAGKAITPYADARVGEAIQGIASQDVKSIKTGLDLNPFLNGDDKTRKEIIAKAIEKQARQNLIGGQRYQSTSDFRYEYGSDYLITFLEMQAVGAKVQLYTKVIEAVDFLASMGADINLSVMPLSDGYITLPDGTKKLIYSSVTGIDAEAAIKKSHEYNNVQLILVGISDEHIRLALEGEDVTFVIPFHGSGNTVHQIQVLMNLLGENLDVTTAEDYTPVQSDHVSPKQTKEQKAMWDLRVRILTGDASTLTAKEFDILNKNDYLKDLYNRFYVNENAEEFGIKLSKDVAGQIFPYEYWDKSLTYAEADKNGERFKEYCASMGIIPRFSGMNSKGESVGFGDFTNNKGYWKLLIDRPMYDNTYDADGNWTGYGNYHEQKRINCSDFQVKHLDPEYGSATYGEVMSKANDPKKTNMIVDRAIAQFEKLSDRGTVEVNGEATNEGATIASDFVTHMVDKVKKDGGWYAKDVFKYVEEHPELGFIELIKAKDKDAKKLLEKFLNGVDDIKVLEKLSWYMCQAYGDKDHTWSWADGSTYPYRGATRTFQNAVKKRINAIMTEKVGGTNLGIKNGDASLQDVKDLFNKLNGIEELSSLADKVFATAEKLGVNIRFVNQTFVKDVSGDAMGDMIEYKTSYFNDTAVSDQRKASTLLHELIHTCTVYVMHEDSKYNFMGEYASISGKSADYVKLRNAGTKLNQIFSEIQRDPDFKGQYGLKNSQEMVAELANEKFVALLKKKSLWERIIEAIAELFGFSKGNTAYDNVLQCLDYMLDNPDIPEYKAFAKEQRENARYNGMDVFGSTKYTDYYGNDRVMYSDRSPSSVSTRSLLANALETTAQNDVEKNKLAQYKSKIELIESEYAKLAEIKKQANDLRFTKGRTPEESKRLKALDFEANQIANRINVYDRQLLNLESTTALKNVLQREKKMAYDKAKKEGKEALARYREKAAQTQRELMNRNTESRREAINKVRETRDKNDAKEKLQKLVIETSKWLSYPAKDDVKCPDILREPYAKFLEGINLSSKRVLEGGDPTHNDMRVANAMSSLATAIERIKTAQDPNITTDQVLDSGYLDLPADFVEQIRTMAEDISKMMVKGDYIINQMSSTDIKQISKIIRTLNHAIKEMSTLYSNLRFANVEGLGDSTMTFLDSMGETKGNNSIADFVGWDNALPYYAFKRFGDGGESIFTGLMDAQDKLAKLASTIFEFKDKTWTDKEAKAWGEDTHTINLPSGGSLTLTTADAMGIYCLSRRDQGLQHLLGGGTRVIGLKKGAKQANDSRSTLTQEDINAIVSSLSDRQKNVALAIQEFMSSVCSEWGNEISMKRFLTREFTDPHYYPIESNDENLTAKDPQAQQSDLYRLLNISATKPLTPGANNEVIIRNIFEVFTEHASDMARLNAFGLPLLDYMKWLNYREKTVNDDGQITVRGVHKSMKRTYGDKAWNYVLNLIKDVNGRHNDNGDNPFLMNMMRMSKTAAVGNNLRVAFLQFTSYPRASMVLSASSLAKGLTKVPQIEKAKKYCGIALWKSYGFYDTNIARSIEDQIKGATNIRQKIIELSMKTPELADAITWGALWNACEYEVAKTTKNKIGSEEFYKEVGLKLREVVYATQVVDSILTRSQIMRSKSGLTQTATAYMSEPTLTANILMDAGFQFQKEKRISGSAKTAWKKTGKIVCKAVGNYCVLQLLTSLAESLADAWRDDDDEEFKEKFKKAFVENVITNIIPFNKIPIISDIADLILSRFGIGFVSSDNLATSWVTQTADALDVWSEVLGEKLGGEETSKTVYNAIYKTAKAISSLTGVSVSGLMREVVTLWNNTAGEYDVTLKLKTFESSQTELGNELYDAIVDGDNRQAESFKAQFEDDGAIESAIKQALRENDSRIKEAAKAHSNGNIRSFSNYIDTIVAEGHFDRETVESAIRAEESAFNTKVNKAAEAKNSGDDAEYKKIVRELRDSYRGIYSQDEIVSLVTKAQEEQLATEDEDVEEATSIYKASDINDAFESGDTDMALEVIDDLIKTKVANGMTEKEAKSSIRSSMTSYWKPLYKEAYKSGNTAEKERIERILKASGLYGSASEVIKTCREWRTERD